MFLAKATAVLLLTLAPAGVAGLKVQEADPCTCLKWSEAYTPQYGGICSKDRELRFFNSFTVDEHVKEFCDAFFLKVTDNFCVNTYIGSHLQPLGQQWCYVSPHCSDLGEGGVLTKNKEDIIMGRTKLAYKTCTEGKDQLLLHKSPLELQEIARAQNVALSMLALQAYPFYLATSYESGNSTALASETSLLFDFDPKPSPPMLISTPHAKSKYLIDYAVDHDQLKATAEAGRLFALNKMTCVEGECMTNSTK